MRLSPGVPKQVSKGRVDGDPGRPGGRAAEPLRRSPAARMPWPVRPPRLGIAREDPAQSLAPRPTCSHSAASPSRAVAGTPSAAGSALSPPMVDALHVARRRAGRAKPSDRRMSATRSARSTTPGDRRAVELKRVADRIAPAIPDGHEINRAGSPVTIRWQGQGGSVGIGACQYE